MAAPDVTAVAATTSASETLQNGSTNWTSTVVGTQPSWLSVRARTVSSGRFLSAADDSSVAAVTVLGSSTATELFGPVGPVGQSVTVDGKPFEVIGVLAPSGSTGASNDDDQAIIPMSTAQQRVIGGTTRTSVQTIYVQAAPSDVMSAAYQETQSLLLALHGIDAVADADFTVTSQESLVSAASSVDKTLTVLLAGIAAISLLVGGIGVMNIMLVSVTERVREIGLPPLISDPIAVSVPAVVGSIVVALAIGLGFGV